MRRSTSGFRVLGLALAACAAWLALSTPALADTSEPTAAAAGDGKVVGLAFIGRTVSDLDKSVAFYKALGFSQDPAANPAWRKDEVIEQLYSTKGVETRMAKMFVVNQSSGQRFVVYLRELKGIERKNWSDHTAWEPGATHFGLVVPDANKLWGELKASGLLRARSWGGELIAPPGQTKGMLAYITDPDGLDIEIIDQRPATPAAEGRPARPAFVPGVSHVGLMVLDSDKARGFYETFLGGELQAKEAPWMKGDFYDSVVGGHGNILRFYNEAFAFVGANGAKINLELVEFQNRKSPNRPTRISDIGVGYVGIEVEGLDAMLARAQAAGAKLVSKGIATMRSGTREVMIRDPDVGGFVLLYEHPKK